MVARPARATLKYLGAAGHRVGEAETPVEAGATLLGRVMVARQRMSPATQAARCSQEAVARPEMEVRAMDAAARSHAMWMVVLEGFRYLLSLRLR